MLYKIDLNIIQTYFVIMKNGRNMERNRRFQALLYK
jgi:hypothetical protein